MSPGVSFWRSISRLFYIGLPLPSISSLSLAGSVLFFGLPFGFVPVELFLPAPHPKSLQCLGQIVLGAKTFSAAGNEKGDALPALLLAIFYADVISVEDIKFIHWMIIALL